MKVSHFLAALGAAVLIPLTVAVPAHADESFWGMNAVEGPVKPLPPPMELTDTCGPVAVDTPSSRYGAVSLVSQSSGPRRFVLSAPGVTNVVVWVYRNGQCVAADIPDDPAEQAAGVVDLDVSFAVGDQIQVDIYTNPLQVPWTLAIRQPGTANAVATGKAAKYVSLDYQIACSSQSATATFTKRFAKVVEDVKWVKVKADGATVKKLKGKKLAKVARKARKGQPYVVTGVPAGTTQLAVVVKLENGRKRTLSRAYSAC